jgi:hypothetical protein
MCLLELLSKYHMTLEFVLVCEILREYHIIIVVTNYCESIVWLSWVTDYRICSLELLSKYHMTLDFITVWELLLEFHMFIVSMSHQESFAWLPWVCDYCMHTFELYQALLHISMRVTVRALYDYDEYETVECACLSYYQNIIWRSTSYQCESYCDCIIWLLWVWVTVRELYDYHEYETITCTCLSYYDNIIWRLTSYQSGYQTITSAHLSYYQNIIWRLTSYHCGYCDSIIWLLGHKLLWEYCMIIVSIRLSHVLAWVILRISYDAWLLSSVRVIVRVLYDYREYVTVACAHLGCYQRIIWLSIS